jgi:PLP dependent protein
MSVAERILKIREELPPGVKLVAVSKTRPEEDIIEAFRAGQVAFGENRVQELARKADNLTKDLEWHFIGNLQANKVKYLVPVVSMIQSVSSAKLLHEIEKAGAKANKTIFCLLELHIAREETKHGMSFAEAEQLLNPERMRGLKNARILGLMGMATFTNDHEVVRKEFRSLADFYRKMIDRGAEDLEILSMGMSNDYKIAIDEGSTLVRIGSAIFG